MDCFDSSGSSSKMLHLKKWRKLVVNSTHLFIIAMKHYPKSYVNYPMFTAYRFCSRREQEMNFTGKTVAEILLGDAEERKKVLEGSREEENLTKSDHTYETIVEQEENAEDESACHNDSSVSSASQLLEDPSPMSWAFSSPPDELDGEFTLKRQRGIRRKRHRKDNEKMYEGKRAKRRLSSHSPSTSAEAVLSQDTLVEAVNPNVKKLALETDLDSTLDEKCAFATKELFSGLDEPPKEEDLVRKASSWELDSPKSTVTDDFHSSKSLLNSVSNTPEAPLVATVRRCLKFSPESELPRPNCYGSIEIEYSVVGDQIHVRGNLLVYNVFSKFL